MIDEKMVKELFDLESRIQSTKNNIANKNYYPSYSPAAEQAAKADLKLFEFHYKKLTMDLTDEDKVELQKLAEQKGWKLEMLKKLKFSKADKESVKKAEKALWETPLPEELTKVLDEQNWGK